MTVTSLHGDNTAILPTLAPGSVQTIVTSPPYFGLRDYGLLPTDWPEVTYVPVAGLEPITIPAMRCCLGLDPTPAAYIGHLVHTWRLLAPVLRDDGTCWLNLGDSYAGQGGQGPQAGDKFKARNGLKSKNLLGIPWRAAFALQADGWYLRSDVIWAKPNAMPESVTDRPTRAHEYLFLLAKSERYYYDAVAVAEPLSAPSKFANEITARNRRTVWSIATQPYSDAHFAVMPEALIEPCILAGSSARACEHCGAPWVRVVERESNWQERKAAGATAGNVGTSETYQNGVHGKNMSHDLGSKTMRDLGLAPSCTCADNTGSSASVVLDLYGGSGTVGKVATRLQRDAVLIDLNPDYIALQAERVDKVQVEMFV